MSTERVEPLPCGCYEKDYSGQCPEHGVPAPPADAGARNGYIEYVAYDALLKQRDALAERVAELEKEKATAYACGVEDAHRCEKRHATIDALEQRVAALTEALREIGEGRGAFSRDNYEFACNVIENAKSIAAAALAAKVKP